MHFSHFNLYPQFLEMIFTSNEEKDVHAGHDSCFSDAHYTYINDMVSNLIFELIQNHRDI